MVKNILITGGTGFVGKHILHELLINNYNVFLLTRKPLRAEFPNLKTIYGDIRFPIELIKFEIHAVIHLVGIIRENPKKGITYENIHIRGTQNVLELAKKLNVKKFIHMSALGSDLKITPYQISKFQAEKIVEESSLTFTIFKPSIIFSKDNHLIKMLTNLAKSTRILPYPSLAQKSFVQPVFVRDVAKGFVLSLINPDTDNKTYEVAGPEVISFKDFILTIKNLIKGPVLTLRIPQTIMYLTSRLPLAPFTREQMTLLGLNNTSENWKVFYETLGLTPTYFSEWASNFKSIEAS